MDRPDLLDRPDRWDPSWPNPRPVAVPPTRRFLTALALAFLGVGAYMAGAALWAGMQPWTR